MIIKSKIGNLNSFGLQDRTVDLLPLEWHETSKKILTKKTTNGLWVTMKLLNENSILLQNDIVFADDDSVIAIDIEPCKVIVVKPATMYEMAYVCYEIGNKHLPLFYENEELLVPYELPVLKLLQAANFNPVIEERKLLNQLRSTVSPHGHQTNSESLFSKILKLTTPASNE